MEKYRKLHEDIFEDYEEFGKGIDWEDFLEFDDSFDFDEIDDSEYDEDFDIEIPSKSLDEISELNLEK